MVRAPLVILGVVTLTFLLLHAAPGSPVSHLLGPSASPAELAAVERSFGLDRPVAEQYLRWIGQAVRGRFGTSIATGRPVLGMVAEAWPATAILVGLSILLAALPGYWLAFALVMVFTYTLRWLPAFGATGIDSGFLSPGERLLDRLTHLALPLATLTLIGIGTTARYAQGTLKRVARDPYLTVARAKGASRLRVLLRHHLRNGLVPVVALLGLSLPALFSGAVFVEAVFAWPGVGSRLLSAMW